MDTTICPKCESEETYMDYEDVYEKGYTERVCEDCGCRYKVTYRVEAIGVIVI
jgi:transcription initiation factor TFIIIB Brf1 subunit/transcription initiation factor TFIIB